MAKDDGGDAASLSPPLLPFRNKDDLDETEKDELEMLVDRLTLSCDTLSKSKSRGIKRRFGRDESKEIEEDIGNLLILLNDWLSRPRATTVPRVELSAEARRCCRQLMDLLEESDVGDKSDIEDDVVHRIWEACVAFVDSLGLEEAIIDDEIMWKPDAHGQRFEPPNHNSANLVFNHQAPDPEEAAQVEEERNARLAEAVKAADSNRVRTAVMRGAPIPVEELVRDMLEDAPGDKGDYYSGLLGADWLKRSEQRLLQAGKAEAEAAEDTAEARVRDSEDETSGGSSDEDEEDYELMNNPDADYIPRDESVVADGDDGGATYRQEDDEAEEEEDEYEAVDEEGEEHEMESQQGSTDDDE